MSTENTNKLISEAIVDKEKLTSIMESQTKDIISTIINGIINEDKDSEDNEDYSIEDSDTIVTEPLDKEESGSEEDDNSSKESESNDAVDSDVVDNADADNVDITTTDEGDSTSTDITDDDAKEWADAEKYKISDAEYDLSQASEDDTIKIYRMLNDTDEIIVKKEDGKVTLDIEEPGTYVVDTKADEKLDNNSEEDDDIFEISLDGIEENLNDDSCNCDENMSETAEEEVNTCDSNVKTEEAMPEEDSVEENVTHTSNNSVHMTKKPEQFKEYGPEGRPQRNLEENNETQQKLIKILDNYKVILEQNKQLTALVADFRNKLKQNALLNTNLAYSVKLMAEHATTKEEKYDILKKFASAQSMKESEKIYETLNEEFDKKAPLVEGKRFDNTDSFYSVTSTNKDNINESKIYQSVELSGIMDLMKRVDEI